MGASGPRKVRRDAREKLWARQHPDAGDKGEFRHLAFLAWARPAARDTVSADRCREIHAVATENLANLGEYGVTDAKLVALQA